MVPRVPCRQTTSNWYASGTHAQSLLFSCTLFSRTTMLTYIAFTDIMNERTNERTKVSSRFDNDEPCRSRCYVALAPRSSSLASRDRPAWLLLPRIYHILSSKTLSLPSMLTYLSISPSLSRPHILFVVSPLVVLTQIAIFTWPAIKITTPI